jgi:hypothetical protein
MSPDGKSFITSVGTQDSMGWIHEQSGDHPIAIEGQVGKPVAAGEQERKNRRSARFSADGKRIYYLIANGRTAGSELWSREVATGKVEQVLPSYSMSNYSVSRDGKQVAFAMADQSGRSNLWIAPTDHSSSPRHLESSTVEDFPAFLPDGDLLFQEVAGGADFLFRAHADGSGRRKIGSSSILDFEAVSPDGRWAVVQLPDASNGHAYSIFALPIEGGTPVRLCTTTCLPDWDTSGDFLYVGFLVGDQNTYALPVRRGWGLPDLPATSIRGIEDLRQMKSAVLIPHVVSSAVSPSLYAYLVMTTHRNLYRVPLP